MPCLRPHQLACYQQFQLACYQQFQCYLLNVVHHEPCLCAFYVLLVTLKNTLTHTLTQTLSCYCLNTYTTYLTHSRMSRRHSVTLCHTFQHEHTHSKVSYLFGCIFMVRNTLSDHGKAVAQQAEISSMML